LQKSAAIDSEIIFLKKKILSPENANPILLAKNSAPIKSGTSIADLIKRPELELKDFDSLREKNFSCAKKNLCEEKIFCEKKFSNEEKKFCEKNSREKNFLCEEKKFCEEDSCEKNFSCEEKNFFAQTIDEQVNIQIKYEGYIAIQLAQAESFRKMENNLIPLDIDYEKISGLRIEARQKLSALRPKNFGQASRVTGISPADLSVLMVYCKTL